MVARVLVPVLTLWTLPTEWGKVRPASCRDKGRRGLVLVLVGRRPVGLTQPRPLVRPPGQAQGPHPSPRPPLVPTGRRQTFPIIARFGRQHSLGLDLAVGEELSCAFEPCLSTGQRSSKIEVTDLWIVQNFVVCSFQAHLSALHHNSTC